jgi:hypothetical protein
MLGRTLSIGREVTWGVDVEWGTGTGYKQAARRRRGPALSLTADAASACSAPGKRPTAAIGGRASSGWPGRHVKLGLLSGYLALSANFCMLVCYPRDILPRRLRRTRGPVLLQLASVCLLAKGAT